MMKDAEYRASSIERKGANEPYTCGVTLTVNSVAVVTVSGAERELVRIAAGAVVAALNKAMGV